MIAALFLACLPDLTVAPTPMMRGDAPVVGAPLACPGQPPALSGEWDGIRLYARRVEPTVGPWAMVAEFERERRDYDQDGQIDEVICAGVDWPIPVQRFIEDELTLYEFVLRGWKREPTAIVESCLDSNVVSICMPEIWDGPPHPYE